MRICSLVLLLICSVAGATTNFTRDVNITFGDGRAKILEDGNLLTLSLDNSSGSGFQSKDQYMHGKFDIRLKLVPNNSAGTVTTFYLSSIGPKHDEIDFEFLGNLSGDPYTLHTNVYTQGNGSREQQFFLWFDPTKDFHTYSILWNPLSIIFSVDGTPIRQFKNLNASIYPTNQPMWIYSSLWDAEDWATRGGLVKTNWTLAPFTASYRNFSAISCPTNNSSSCSQAGSWFSESLNKTELITMHKIQKKYMIYNYCTDTNRFPRGFPPECSTA